MCDTVKADFERKFKKSLKWFLGLNKNTPDATLFTLVDINFHTWASSEELKARLKWEARVSRSEIVDLPRYSIKCNTKWLPKEVATFVNLQNHICKECNVRLSHHHLQMHNIIIPKLEDLLSSLSLTGEEIGAECEKRSKRKTIIQILSRMVNIHIDTIKRFINQQDSDMKNKDGNDLRDPRIMASRREAFQNDSMLIE